MSSQAQTQPGVSTWQSDPAHTLVEFSARHMMITTVKGRFTDVSATIVMDEADMSRSSVEAAIDASSVDTREQQRDGHLRSADFLDVENHPTITFKSTRVEHAGKDRLRVIGDLTIRGVTKPVTLDATFNGTGTTPYGAHVAGFTAETSINRKDFGLNWNVALEAGGIVVGDTIKIALEVEAIKQS